MQWWPNALAPLLRTSLFSIIFSSLCKLSYFWRASWWVHLASKFITCNLANFFCIQLRHLQYIHSRNFIHRDLKPSNIVTGVGKHANLVYIIDFGLSKQFRDPNTRRHIPYNTSRGFTGTADFASVNSHRGLELGRRDDLESLAYILIYFVHGSLPWQGMGQNIHAVKQGITLHHMFKELPAEFLIFLQHCRSLAFDDKPNYDYYLNLFNNLLPEGLQSNPTFDWISSDEWRCAVQGMYYVLAHSLAC